MNDPLEECMDAVEDAFVLSGIAAEVCGQPAAIRAILEGLRRGARACEMPTMLESIDELELALATIVQTGN